MGDKCTTFTSHLSPSFPQHITTAQHGRKKDLIIIQKTSSSVQSTQTRYWKRCGPNGKTKKDVVFFFWNVWVCAAKWQTCSVEQLPIAASLCGIGHLNETTFSAIDSQNAIVHLLRCYIGDWRESAMYRSTQKAWRPSDRNRHRPRRNQKQRITLAESWVQWPPAGQLTSTQTYQQSKDNTGNKQ